MTPASGQIARWKPQVQLAAKTWEVDPYVLAAIAVQESGGIYCLPDGSCNPYAIRPEPGFWRTYAAGIRRWVEGTPDPTDNRWYQFEDLYSCSYGLCQVMLQTAYENGFQGKFPTELCDPQTNLNVAAAIFARRLFRARGNVDAALLSYNGGGDPSYPQKVHKHRASLEVDGVFG